MIRISLILLLTIFQSAYAENILLGISGLAKVGNDCFLTVSFKNNSTVKVNFIKAVIFVRNDDILSVGKSEIILKNLENNQPYLISKKINKNEALACNKIKVVDAYISNCTLSKNDEKKLCNKLLKVESALTNNQIEFVNKLDNTIFYEDKEEENFLIPELNIILSPLNIKLAMKYNIKLQRSGMVVTDNMSSIFFKEGDVITELEMSQVLYRDQIELKIKEVVKENKSLILINLIRNNKEKIIAAKINN